MSADHSGFLLELDPKGVPWLVDPYPGTFLAPEGAGVVRVLIVEAGAIVQGASVERLGTGGTRDVAAALAGAGDVVVVGSRVRFEVAGRELVDRERHEIRAASVEEMRRNGLRLFERIDHALREDAGEEKLNRTRTVVRWFPDVAFRHRGVAEALDRLDDPDATLRRWFGLSAGRGRRGQPVGEARALVGTLVAECASAVSIGSALEQLENAGMGTREGLANRRARERELYELCVEGVWVEADRLMRLPWVGPSAAAMRWDVYRLPDVQP